MRIKERFNRRELYRLIPILAGLVLSYALLVFFSLDFAAFRLSYRGGHSSNAQAVNLFLDWDGDGGDELVECAYTARVKKNRCSCCKIYRLNEDRQRTTLAQVNVPDISFSTHPVFSADIDQRDGEELYILSGDDNQLHLYQFQRAGRGKPSAVLALDSFRAWQGQVDVQIHLIDQKDRNGDGVGELLVLAANSYPVSPRRTYWVDFARNGVEKGPPTAFLGLNARVPISHAPGIGYTGFQGIFNNWHESLKLAWPDTTAYAFVLGEDLNFRFAPIPVGSFPALAGCLLRDSFLFSLEKGPAGYTLAKRRASTGKKADSLLLGARPRTLSFFPLDPQHLGLSLDNRLLWVTNDLEITFDRRFAGQQGIKNIDFDADGKWEYLVKGEEKEPYAIWSSDLKYHFNWEPNFARLENSATAQFGNEKEWVVSDGQSLAYFQYQSNAHYWLRWPYWAALLLGGQFLSWYGFRFYDKNLNRQRALQQEMQRLQYLAVKSQMDPHFALNALNSIDWMYRNKQEDQASAYLHRLSRMLYRAVLDSEEMIIPLEDELAFCRYYCEIEQMRDEKFSFRISTDFPAGILRVPRQFVFIFVENALKHGLRPKEHGLRELQIQVKEESPHFWRIYIKDNGIGLEQGAATAGTGKGLAMAEEMARLYRAHGSARLEYEISSRANAGTRVVVSIGPES